MTEHSNCAKRALEDATLSVERHRLAKYRKALRECRQEIATAYQQLAHSWELLRRLDKLFSGEKRK